MKPLRRRREIFEDERSSRCVGYTLTAAAQNNGPPGDPTVQRFSRSGFRLGLAETRDAVAFFPLTALFEEFGAFETLEDIALATQGGCRA